MELREPPDQTTPEWLRSVAVWIDGPNRSKMLDAADEMERLHARVAELERQSDDVLIAKLNGTYKPIV